jgi:hypothetical protein
MSKLQKYILVSVIVSVIGWFVQERFADIIRGVK